MSVTLNIIEHELSKHGGIMRSNAGNPRFDDVRFALRGKAVDPSIFYVCEDAEAVSTVHAAGACCICANPAAEEADFVALDAQDPLMLFDTLLDIFRTYDEWQRSMVRTCHTGGSLQELLDVSEPFLLNNVVVLDPALKLIAYTKHTPCDDPITMELIAHGYHTEDNIRKFKLHKRFKPWSEDEGFVVNDTNEICKYTTIVKSFKARSSFSLISVMMCNVADPEPYLFDIFEMFTSAIEFYAQRDYPDGKPSGNAIDTFLNDLIAGSVDNESAIVERCQYVGLPYEATFCLFYTTPAEDSVPVTRLLADVALVVAPAKAILVGNAVAVLCFNCSTNPCDEQCEMHQCTHVGKTISERLDDMMGRYDLSCGRSAKFFRLSDVAVAFAQAKAAYELGMRIGPKPDAPDSSISGSATNLLAGSAPTCAGMRHRTPARLFPFDRYCMNYLMEQLGDDQARLVISTHAGRIIAQIAANDAEANTDNYEFLYAYLLHERRTSTVADALHMHRNNVNYRIGRIEELYDIDVSDPSLRIDLLIAYQLRSAALVQNAQSHLDN